MSQILSCPFHHKPIFCLSLFISKNDDKLLARSVITNSEELYAKQESDLPIWDSIFKLEMEIFYNWNLHLTVSFKINNNEICINFYSITFLSITLKLKNTKKRFMNYFAHPKDSYVFPLFLKNLSYFTCNQWRIQDFPDGGSNL